MTTSWTKNPSGSQGVELNKVPNEMLHSWVKYDGMTCWVSTLCQIRWYDLLSVNLPQSSITYKNMVFILFTDVGDWRALIIQNVLL